MPMFIAMQSSCAMVVPFILILMALFLSKVN